MSPNTGLELEGLAREWALPADAVAQLARLLERITLDPHAPTTLRSPEAILRDHISDSLVALELDEIRTATRVADIGSGAGFPGLPLAVALPKAQVSLIESNTRKARFIERTAAACGILNAEVLDARVEDVGRIAGDFDVVTVRAVAELAVAAEYAAPLLRVGGALVAWRGRRDPGAEAVAARAAEILGLERRPPLRVEPYQGARDRHLHLMVKVRETPANFPRRPGIAGKRPLGYEGGPSDRVRR